MVRTFSISIFILLATAVAAHAAAVRAVVDRNRTTVGDSIALQVTIEDGDGDVDLSGLTDFKSISRGSTSSFQMVNGRTSRQMIYNYVLIPLKTGNLTIPSIPVTIDGQIHYTVPIRISVSKEPPADSGRRDVYVTAELSTSSPWVGQQIVYTFRLYNAVQVADAKFQPPEFEGFHAEELEDRKSHRTVINGREFIVTEVKFILVPFKTGTLTIEPAVLQVGMVSRSRRARPFSGMDAFFGRNEMTTRVLQSDPIAVTVRELPPKPADMDFSGLVGRFDIRATLDKTELDTGDSTTLTVTISGQGNIMDAAAPPIPAPAGFKTYSDNPEETIQKDDNGYSGSKTFRTALVPVQPGEYRIDPVALTYFDVQQGNYRTVVTPAAMIQVSPSDTAANDIDVFRAAQGQTPSLKKRVEFTGRDILPLKESLAALEPRRGLSPLWFAVLMLLPMVGFTLTLTVVRARHKDATPAQIMTERARSAIKSASIAGTTDAEFLSALYRGLVSAILGRKGVMGTSLTWSEARGHLSELGWDEADVATTAKLLEEIESFNYSGGSLDGTTRSDLLERTRQSLRRLTR